MEEEFNRLLEMFAKNYDGQEISIEKILSEALVFFDTIKKKLENAPPEEREEMVRSMQEMYTKLMLEGKKLSEKSGISEETLAHAAENPANFTPEQWDILCEAKQEMLNATRQITRIIQGKASEEEPSAQSTEQGPASPKAPKKPTLSKRDRWMKS